VLVLPLLACAAHPEAPADPVATCDTGPELLAEDLDFGPIYVGDEGVQLLTLENAGCAPVELRNVQLEDPAAPFSVEPVATPILPSGDETTVRVTFAPTSAGSFLTHLGVTTWQPDGSPVWIDLAGVGVDDPVLDLPPTNDLGVVGVGCTEERRIPLANTGTGDLVVTAIGLDDPTGAFVLADLADPLPWTLASGEEAALSVAYTPATAPSRDTATLSVTTNDAAAPVRTTTLTGTAEWGPAHVQTWVVSYLADVVFYVDTSDRMQDNLHGLARAWDRLVDALAGTGVDYRVGVVTDPDGCVNGPNPYVDGTLNRADQAAALQAMVDDAGGGDGQGFATLLAALDPVNVGPGGCNEGLRRDTARLTVVGVSDQPEQSPDPWQDYVRALRAPLPTDDFLRVDAIIGGDPACGGALPGFGWSEAVDWTRGVYAAICVPWEDTLATIGEVEVSGEKDYQLEAWPLVSSITVTVDGVVTTQWAYEEADNRVDLADPPPEGSRVIITFHEAACP
jgi:hypothetical protein